MTLEKYYAKKLLVNFIKAHARTLGQGPIQKEWGPSSLFSTRWLFSREATFSFVGIAFADVISDADKGKSRFARKKSPSGKRASHSLWPCPPVFWGPLPSELHFPSPTFCHIKLRIIINTGLYVWCSPENLLDSTYVARTKPLLVVAFALLSVSWLHDS